MSNPNERGFLHNRFDDQDHEPLPPELSWEKVAKNVLSPPPRQEERKRVFLWWWFAAVVLVAGLALVGINSFGVNKEATVTSREEIVSPPAVSPTGPAQITKPATLNSTGNGAMNSVPPAISPAVSGRNGSTRVSTLLAAQNTTEGASNAGLNREASTVAVNRYADRKQLNASSLTVIAELPRLPLSNVPVDPVIPAAELELPVPAVIIPVKPFTAVSLTGGLIGYRAGYQPQNDGFDPSTIESPEIGLQAELRIDRSLAKRWYISTGIAYRRYNFRSAFNTTDTDIDLYRPGTVDTIFRNVITGEERVVTTDTLSGTRIRRFGNDNVITEASVPFLIGRRFGQNGTTFGIAAGMRVGYVAGRSGRVAVSRDQVVSLNETPFYSNDFRLHSRLEFAVDQSFGKRVGLIARLGGELSLLDWHGSAVAGRRPLAADASVGLRLRL